MGLLDLPAVLLDPVQGWLHGLFPRPLSLGLWAVLLAAASMWLYQRCSDQRELARIRPLRRQASRELAAYDGPFGGLWPLIGRNLSLSAHQLKLTLAPSLAAAVPLLLALPWLSNTFGHGFPQAGDRITVAVDTATPYSMVWDDNADAQRLAATRWQISWPGAGGETTLYRHGNRVVTLPQDAPITVVHKRQWWNILVDNPAGHLEDGIPAESIRIELPALQYLPFGPPLMRGWLPFFLLVTLTASLAIKLAWRIR